MPTTLSIETKRTVTNYINESQILLAAGAQDTQKQLSHELWKAREESLLILSNTWFVPYLGSEDYRQWRSVVKESNTRSRVELAEIVAATYEVLPEEDSWWKSAIKDSRSSSFNFPASGPAGASGGLPRKSPSATSIKSGGAATDKAQAKQSKKSATAGEKTKRKKTDSDEEKDAGDDDDDDDTIHSAIAHLMEKEEGSSSKNHHHVANDDDQHHLPPIEELRLPEVDGRSDVDAAEKKGNSGGSRLAADAKAVAALGSDTNLQSSPKTPNGQDDSSIVLPSRATKTLADNFSAAVQYNTTLVKDSVLVTPFSQTPRGLSDLIAAAKRDDDEMQSVGGTSSRFLPPPALDIIVEEAGTAANNGSSSLTQDRLTMLQATLGNGKNPQEVTSLLNYDRAAIERKRIKYAREASQRAITKLICSSSWLVKLICMMDSLPICLTIASADEKSCPGFPLIHVNKYFQMATGYTYDEVLGKNCKFLQQRKASAGGKSGTAAATSSTGATGGLVSRLNGPQRVDPEELLRLSEALRQGLPTRCTLLNYRKDGSSFENMLIVKPVYTDDGTYACVVAFQFDLSQESLDAQKTSSTTNLPNLDASRISVAIADGLLKHLPSTLSGSAEAEAKILGRLTSSS
jgi:hypothetical protein